MPTLVEAGLASFLEALDGLSAVSTRIEPAVSNQSSTLPRIRYMRIAEPTRHISNSGFSGLSQTIFQVDVIASTYSQAKTLAAVIQDEDGFQGDISPDREVQQLRVMQTRDVPQPAAGGTAIQPYMVTLELWVWHRAKE
jgi:hypothetical protein